MTTPSNNLHVSNFQAAMFALLPGQAEKLEQISIRYGKMTWDGMAKRVKYSRNALYIGGALTTISTVGLALSTGPVGTTLAILGLSCGLSISALATKRLYKATELIQSYINAGHRPN